MTTEVEIGLAPHPAVFNDKIMGAIREMIHPLAISTILDPFAGTGRIHELRPRYRTYGMEIEPEWANHNGYMDKGWTIVADVERYLVSALEGHGLPTEYDACITSPCYGNRMADHHEAKDGSKRNTYRHKLGRELTPNNSGMMQWGDEYRAFHTSVWEQVTPLIRNYFILNIKDHIRKGRRIRVSQWHLDTLREIGWRPIEVVKVDAKGNRHGANADLRVGYEYVVLFEKGHG